MGALSLRSILAIVVFTVVGVCCAYVVYCGSRVLISSERYKWTRGDTAMLLTFALVEFVCSFEIWSLITGDV